VEDEEEGYRIEVGREGGRARGREGGRVEESWKRRR
jgi:hypothetical protein